MIISNLSYQVFDKILSKKLNLKKIHVKINYLDYSSFLSKKFNDNNEFNFVIFFPDISDFNDISNYSDNIFFDPKDFSEIINFYNFILKKINKFDLKIFISNLINYQKLEFGTYTRKNKNIRHNLVNKVNEFLYEQIKKNNFYLFDFELIAFKFGVDNFRENEKFFYGSIPFSLEFAEHIFSILSNLIAIALGKVKKLLILDLDNTLWGGILGDDGPNGIIIGNNSPVGKAFLDFQKTILNLKKRGVLLAICSKNDLKNVQQVFNNNKNLILNIDDFVSIKVNWENKAKNIREISDEINIGLDTFVFFDDNPVERNLVRDYLPEVSVPEIGEDPSYYSSILLNNFYFDLIAYTKEDLSRSKTYLTNAKREKLKNNFENIDEYLKSLKMTCEVSNFKKENFDRVVQLFQRSNQFNFTTIRYSLAEIKKIVKKKSQVTFQFTFKDKFSNYGIISLLICSFNKQNLIIENWVMSCRVLNRTLENFIVNKIFEFCKKNKIKNILSIYIETAKNILVKNLYEELGFQIKNKKNKKTFFIYNVDKYENKKTFVKEIF